MKKNKIKHICSLVAVLLIVVNLCSCASYSDYQEYKKDYEEFQEYKKYKEELAKAQETAESTEELETESVSIAETEGSTEQGSTKQGGTEQPESVSEPEEEAVTGIRALTEEEIAIRRALQEAYVREREEVYTWPASYEKTVKINELDKKILENAYYSFEDNQIVFIGDSITEGVGGNIDAEGKKVSYVNYTNEALNFKLVLNHGKAGRTVTNYGEPEMSIDTNISNVINIDCDIAVVFIGVNDYLYYSTEKRFGALDNGSTAGYCGALQSFVEAVERDYANKEYFFVTTYPLLSTDASTYTDYEGAPTFNDYMEIQRILADRYGYHMIDIYNSGFMSTQDAVTTANLIPDGIHPNDAGYRMLGEHIAAELLLYYESAMDE